MASLSALKQKIKNITDYSPELAAYNNSLDQLINDAYMEIWTSKRWTFATKEYLFPFFPDILPTRDVIAPATIVNANVQKGSRQITFSAAIDRLSPIWEGQPIEIQSYEYTISKVVSSTVILLDRPFVGTTNTDDTTWSIKFRWYDLPQDCIELLSLSHRDIPFSNGGSGLFPPYGKLVAILPRRDEELNLRMDYKAAWAEGFVWSPSFFVPEAHKLVVEAVGQQEEIGFPAGTFLEVCWAFERDSKVGALSQPSTIAFPAGDGTFSLVTSFVSWDDQAIVADTFQSNDRGPTQWEGLRKVVYWNANFNRTTGERLGLPVWRTFNNPGGSNTRNTLTYLAPVVAQDTDSSVTITNFNQIDPGNPIYIEWDGQYNRIRPYPRVDAWDFEVIKQAGGGVNPAVPQNFLREGVARYYYKPSYLGFQTDSPQMPHEFHQLIVYKCLQTLYDKVGSATSSELYRRRIEDEMKGLTKRYVDHVDSQVVRGQFQIGGGRRFNYDYSSLRNGGV